MKSLFNNLWIRTAIVALFSIGVLVFISVVNSTWYSGTFSLRWTINLCVIAIQVHLVSCFTDKKKRWANRIFRICSFIAPVVAIVLFLVFKPVYTVQDAIDKIEQTSDYIHVQLNEQYHLMNFSPKANLFVSTGYVLSARKDDKKHTFIFNPVTGEYHPIDR